VFGALAGFGKSLDSDSALDAAFAAVRAGACAIDITPETLPVTVNGEFLSREVDTVKDRLHARAIVLESGKERFAICVVDSLTIGRELLDEAKHIAFERTGILTERMLVSATHTHSAPSVMACLGTEVDWAYAWFLTRKIAEAIERANELLEPARIGWTSVPAWGFTHCRRWIFQPAHAQMDPFGERSARANMHPGYGNPNVVSPSGPVDPAVGILSIQTQSGEPLALLANFSMHYLGAEPLSADYFGEFASGLGRALGADPKIFVGVMSQGTCGDAQWMDYSQPRQKHPTDYAKSLVQIVAQASRSIPHHSRIPIRMCESKITLNRRMPDEMRLSWARNLTAALGRRPPRTPQEVYAREQILIAAEPQREVKLQALQIGSLGITALPFEAFALTGLKIKEQSPLEVTFHVGLANGSEGYVPPPEQHKLGGYTTWLARTASMEVGAEPKVVEESLRLLESVSGLNRKPPGDSSSRYEDAILEDRPQAFWRLNDLGGVGPRDRFGRHKAVFEDGVVFGLPGVQRWGGAKSQRPEVESVFQGDGVNRAAHFVGGRLKIMLHELGPHYTMEFWVWNGMPHHLRPVAGWLFSRGVDGDKKGLGDHLGIAGNAPSTTPGCLLFWKGAGFEAALCGSTPLSNERWHHVVFVRERAAVRVYLDGKLEIHGQASVELNERAQMAFLGGRFDGVDGLEGRIDEVALYDTPLAADRVRAHFRVFEHGEVRRGSLVEVKGKSRVSK
jgi:hypothetical protein